MDINTTVISAFTKATIETFATMVDLDVYPRQARSEEERIVGKGVRHYRYEWWDRGASVLSLPDAMACAVIEKFIGDKQTEITPEVVDGVRELVNIVIGAAKTPMVEAGLEFAFGLPKTMLACCSAPMKDPISIT